MCTEGLPFAPVSPKTIFCTIHRPCKQDVPFRDPVAAFSSSSPGGQRGQAWVPGSALAPGGSRCRLISSPARGRGVPAQVGVHRAAHTDARGSGPGCEVRVQLAGRPGASPTGGIRPGSLGRRGSPGYDPGELVRGTDGRLRQRSGEEGAGDCLKPWLSGPRCPQHSDGLAPSLRGPESQGLRPWKRAPAPLRAS